MLFEVDVLWNILRIAFRRRRVLLKRQRHRKKSSVFGAFKHVDQLLLPTIYIRVLHSKYSMHPLFHVLNLVWTLSKPLIKMAKSWNVYKTSFYPWLSKNETSISLKIILILNENSKFKLSIQLFQAKSFWGKTVFWTKTWNLGWANLKKAISVIRLSGIAGI